MEDSFWRRFACWEWCGDWSPKQLPKAPVTVPVDVNARGPRAEGVVNRALPPSPSHARLRSPPRGQHRNLNPSRSPGRFHNPRPGPRHSRNPSPARFPKPPRGRLRSHSHSPNLGLCLSLRLVRWPLPPNLSLSPGLFHRTRSIRRLPPVNRGWAGLREVSPEIARVQVTSVA